MLALMQYGIQMGVINTSPMVFPFTGAWTASSGPINQLPWQCGPFRDAENKIMADLHLFCGDENTKKYVGPPRKNQQKKW